MHKIFLGLGANIGDRKDNIRRAVALLDVSIKNLESDI
jgi:7,8-dihydro-6-hydroxymethylpterin-pyrophosphokinase